MITATQLMCCWCVDSLSQHVHSVSSL